MRSGDKSRRFHPLAAWPRALGAALAGQWPAWAHGDVTPQAVDTKDLPSWAPTGAPRTRTAARRAIKVGTSAYNQNCARCHGLEAISGGIAPDLRKLDNECVTLKDAKKKAPASRRSTSTSPAPCAAAARATARCTCRRSKAS
jgi:mono/diheme cytochrome c family protein